MYLGIHANVFADVSVQCTYSMSYVVNGSSCSINENFFLATGLMIGSEIKITNSFFNSGGVDRRVD